MPLNINVSIHDQLRRATSDQHHRLDRGLAYLLSERLSTDRYVDFLAGLFGFYVPFEDMLADREAAFQPLGLRLIRRAALLKRDLSVFDRAPDQIPRCTEMPALTSVGYVAGAVYVVEGASLGGRVIARTLMQRFGIGRANGGAFLTADGAQTAVRWKRVLTWLAERSGTPDVHNQIVGGACLTFAALIRWLANRGILDD
jgi:heme oxygenase